MPRRRRARAAPLAAAAALAALADVASAGTKAACDPASWESLTGTLPDTLDLPLDCNNMTFAGEPACGAILHIAGARQLRAPEHRRSRRELVTDFDARGAGLRQVCSRCRRPKSSSKGRTTCALRARSVCVRPRRPSETSTAMTASAPSRTALTTMATAQTSGRCSISETGPSHTKVSKWGTLRPRLRLRRPAASRTAARGGGHCARSTA